MRCKSSFNEIGTNTPGFFKAFGSFFYWTMIEWNKMESCYRLTTFHSISRPKIVAAKQAKVWETDLILFELEDESRI